MAVVASPGVIIGRAAERDLLHRLLMSVVTGTGAAVFVEGEAGIGKTRLVESVVDSAQRRDVQTMVGAARPFETTRPLGAVCAALQLRSGSSDPRRAVIADLLGGADERAAALDRDVRYRVVDEIVDLVESESRDAPVLLVLEDLHWADDSTILVVQLLLDRLGNLPVLLVGTLRPVPRSAGLDLLLADASAAGTEVVRLAPLSAGDVDELVRAETGAVPGPGLAEVVRRAAGNPLWVVEILRALAAEGRLDVRSGRAETTTAGLPDSFRQLVLRRLRYLPDPMLHALRVAAVLGDTFSLVDLATVSGRRAVDLVADLSPAVAAQLLVEDGNRLTFRHQLVHEAIYADIPRAGQVAMHREVAGVLAEAGAPLAQVATHVLRGAGPGDLQALGWLRDAACEVLPRAPDVAVDLLEHAEGLVPVGHPARDGVTAALVEALLRVGRVTECATRAEAALRRPHSVESDAALRLSLISALSLQNRASELIAQADAALVATPALPDADRALVLAQASYGRTFAGDLIGGERTARAALETAQRSGDAGSTVWSLTTLAFAVKTQGRYGEAVELTESAARLAGQGPGEQGRLRHPQFFLGMALCDADRMTQARDAYRNGMRECADLGSSWILPDIQQLSGELHVLLGEWDDALVEIEVGLAAAADRGNRVATVQSRGYRGLINAARGDLPAAKAALAPLAAQLDSGSPPYGMEIVGLALALVAEAERRPARAYRMLRSCWQLDTDRQIRRFHRFLAPPLVRLAVTLDHPEVAAEVADGMDEAAALAPDVPSVAAAALRCRGLLDRSPEAMMAAVELVRSSPRILDRVQTFEDAALVLTSAGRVAQGQSLLLEALDLYEQWPAGAWAARVRAALRGVGLGSGVRGPRRRATTGWDSLTDSERAVSRLVAEGLTNREVAARLYVSTHTVNTHLRHVFHKLGVSSRTGLAAAVLRHEG